MFSDGLRNDGHGVRDENDVSVLEESPDFCYFAWFEVVVVEVFGLCALFFRGEAVKPLDGSAAHEVIAEQTIYERVERIPLDVEEVVGRVGVEERPTDVH